MNSAIILAAGKGLRLKNKLPKQFITINGKQILSFSVRAFIEHPLIDEVIIVAMEKDIEKLKKEYPQCKIIKGGETRQESSTNGVNSVQPGAKNVVIHDAARPFVSKDSITECINKLDTHVATGPILDSTDSLVECHNGKYEHIDRSCIKKVLTPLGFRLETIKKAQSSNLTATGEINLVCQCDPNANIYLFKGDNYNFKITERSDLKFAEHLMHNNTHPNNSTFDASNKNVLILGGTGGIGNAIATRLSHFGANVTTVGSEISIQDQNSLDQFANQEWDIIIHSVGVVTYNKKSILKSIEQIDYNEWSEVIKINLTSAFLTCKLALKTITKGGHLLFIGSSASARGRDSFGLYSSTKAALTNLSQSFAEEVKSKKIMVNLINPSRTATKMRAIFPEGENNLLLSPERVAEVATCYCHGNTTGEVFDLRVGD